MITKIKSIANTEDKKRLLSNFFSLSVLEGFNLLLPLITFPYLVRVLGIESYGILGLATAVITFLGIIVDYGFNNTGTRAISINRSRKDKITEIFSSILFIKTILMFFTFVILLFMLLYINKFQEYWNIYLATFGLIIGQVLFPVWFFQGMEKMKYITYINFVVRIVFVLMIFILIKEKEDLIYVPLLNSIGIIASGVYALYFIKKEFGIKYIPQKRNILIKYLNEGKNIFIAGLSGNLYGQGQVIILGFFVNDIILGYYTIAQKMANILIKVFQVLQRTLFPFLSKRKVDNIGSFKNILKMTLKYILLIEVILILPLLFLSENVYMLLTGTSDIIGIYTLKFWIIISFFTILNVMINPFIISLNQDNFMAKFYLLVGISFVVISMLLTNLYKLNGMLYSMLLVEITILVFSVIALKKGYQENE